MTVDAQTSAWRCMLVGRLESLVGNHEGAPVYIVRAYEDRESQTY